MPRLTSKVDSSKTEVEALRAELKALKEEVARLKTQLSKKPVAASRGSDPRVDKIWEALLSYDKTGFEKRLLK